MRKVKFKINAILFLILISQFGCKEDCIKSSKCELVPESGECDALFTKYYFDSSEGKCKEFTYGGCGGVVPFDTLEECKECECSN